MRISQLKFCNFRCFGPDVVEINLDKLTGLVGANGAGKTAVLQGLLRLFGTRPGERKLSRSDFHVSPGIALETIDELELWIEAKLEFPALSADENDPTVPECFRHMIVAAPGAAPFCRIRLEGVWRRTAQTEGEIDEKLCWVMVADADPEEDKKQNMSNYDRGRIQVIYVPASRDPSNQLRQAAGTLLQPLLKAISWSEETRNLASESAKQISEAVRNEQGMRCLESAVCGEWKKLQEFAPLREVQFQPFSPEFDDLLGNFEAVFHPGEGGPQSVERLSDGLRSLFYFSLLGARFDLERMVTPAGEPPPFNFGAAELPYFTFFAIEEPENHLAPQYLSRILALLQRISVHAGAQVILTSHAPGILSRVEPVSIRHLRLDTATGRARIKALTLPENNAGEVYKYVKEAVRAHPELYFATGIILGEGDSESIVLPKLATATGRHLDQRFVCVVPLGGRHVNHFWRLLHELEIPHVTLLDLDRERFGGGWGRIHYAITQLMEFSPDVTLESLELTQEELDEMPENDVEDAIAMEEWMVKLETHGVFYCTPLDLDFSMLSTFPVAYHAATTGTGPRIPNDPAHAELYRERLEQARVAVLKPEGGNGATYTEAELTEFIWYHYLFLGRGKPSTHILALNELTQEAIRDDMPPVFTRLLRRIAPLPLPSRRPAARPSAPPPA